jgi:hypothetical protein
MGYLKLWNSTIQLYHESNLKICCNAGLELCDLFLEQSHRVFELGVFLLEFVNIGNQGRDSGGCV